MIQTIRVIIVLAIIVETVLGFGFSNTISSTHIHTRGIQQTSFDASRIRSKANDKDQTTTTRNGAVTDTESDTESINEVILSRFNQYHSKEKSKYTYTARNLHTFQLKEFKPLGCTAEESLNVESDGSKHVFISKVVTGGNAKIAGIQVGDVIVGLSGSFSDVVEVVGSSLERVKSLIAGRNEGDDDLVIMIMRDSDVMSAHESSLVDACVLPDNDKDIEKCIESMYQADYDMRKGAINGNNSDIDANEAEKSCEDDDMDCMLDAMFNVWSDETGLQKEEKVEEDKKEKKKKPAPWSSRSSPSGTYVRDPKVSRSTVKSESQLFPMS